jgi:hypothetical protein
MAVSTERWTSGLDRFIYYSLLAYRKRLSSSTIRRHRFAIKLLIGDFSSAIQKMKILRSIPREKVNKRSDL